MSPHRLTMNNDDIRAAAEQCLQDAGVVPLPLLEAAVRVLRQELPGRDSFVALVDGNSSLLTSRGRIFQPSSRVTPSEPRIIAVALPKQTRDYAATGAPMQLQ